MVNRTIERLRTLSGIESFYSPRQLFKELCVYEELHGSEHTIPSQAVVEECDIINDPDEVYNVVRELRDDGYPIASNGNGFHIPITRIEIEASLDYIKKKEVGLAKLYHQVEVNMKAHLERLRENTDILGPQTQLSDF